MVLLGHRGTRKYAAENTLRAFELALEHGCDGFEFDVRSTRDGQAVVCHNPRLKRVEVARVSHGDLLRQFPSLPTLEDVLARFAARAYLYIELKVAGLETTVAELLRWYPPQRGCVVASFLSEVVAAMPREFPAGFVCDNKRDLARWASFPAQVVMPNYKLVTRELVDEIHAANRQIFTWTVNHERDMRRMAELGVDGIVSDDTARLCAVLRGQQ